ncbi:MAG: hypothetical protein HKN68_18750 [Saprospiraceae bacterium]|nr:hypothetical protein [Saprospiraceae bacterium]
MKQVLIPLLMVAFIISSCEKENATDPSEVNCRLIQSENTVTNGLIGDEQNITNYYYDNKKRLIQVVEHISGAASADKTTEIIYNGDKIWEVTVTWSHVDNPQYYSFSYDGDLPDTFYYSNDFSDHGYMLLSYSGIKLTGAEYWYKDSYDDVYELKWNETIEWEGDKVVRSSSHDESFDGIVTAHFEYDNKKVPVRLTPMGYINRDFTFLSTNNVTRQYLSVQGNNFFEVNYTYTYNDDGYPLTKTVELAETTNETIYEYNCN